MNIPNRVVLQTLIREHDRLTAKVAENEHDYGLARYEGQLSGINTAIAIFVGANGIDVGDDSGGVPAWLPALRLVAGLPSNPQQEVATP